jgi:flagellar protein FlbD
MPGHSSGSQVAQQMKTCRCPVGIAIRRSERASDRIQDFAPLLFQAAHNDLIGPPPNFKSSTGTADTQMEEIFMIRLTRLNRAPLVLNSDLIEHIDVTPDTVITLTTGQILRVRESADEVIERIVEFRRGIYMQEAPPTHPRDESETGRETNSSEDSGIR